MFYILHTLLITAFIGVAYYLGFRYGVKAKAIKKSKAKVWKALKQEPHIAHNSTSSILNYPNKETSQEDWLKGYRKWKSKRTS